MDSKKKTRSTGKSSRLMVKRALPFRTKRAEGAPVALSLKQSFGSVKTRRIVNSEMVGQVAGSTAFTTSTYFVNPGIIATFPWLSSTAYAWQHYVFHKLRFRYVTSCATSTKGTIILSPEYSARDQIPATEAEASNTQGAVADVCWKEVTCPLDTKAMFPFGPRKMIRTGVVAGEPALYDACRFTICTTGMADGNNVGRLWVDYDVELFVPQTSPSSVQTSKVQYYRLYDNITTTADATYHALPWRTLTGTLYTIDVADGKIVLPRGIYKISGQLGLSNTGTGNGVFRVRLDWNSTDASYPPPYDRTQYFETAITYVADAACSGATLPFLFVVRADTDIAYFRISYSRVNSSPSGGSNSVIANDKSIMAIEPS